MPVPLPCARGRSPHFLLPCRTPLHCAASCNSVHLCKQLVESGAAIFASTISDIETAADKCEEMEEGYLQCSQFLYGRRPGDPPRGRRERCVPPSTDGWEGLSTLRFPAQGCRRSWVS